MTATTYYAVDTNSGGTFPTNSLAKAKRAEFMTALATSKEESFENSIAGSRPSDDFTLTLFGGTAQLTQNNEADGNVQGVKAFGQTFPGRFNTTFDPGSGLLEDGKWWQSSGSFVLRFTTHTQAFGFYGTDFGDLGAAGGSVKLSFYSNGFPVDLNVEVGPETSGVNASLLFFGYTNDVHPFNEIRFTITQPAGQTFIVGFDDLLYGTLDSIKLPYNGTGGFVNAPTECIAACPPEDQQVAYINVPAGFTDRWSTWAAYNGAVSVDVALFTGLNGTGAQLTSTQGIYVSSFAGDAFYQNVVTFSGVARSVRLVNQLGNFSNRAFFDHMEFGIPPELPDAPVIDFNWSLGGMLLTSDQAVYDGVKYGLDFEGLIPGANASAGTYAPVSIGSFYNTLYPGTTFTNAVAVRSKATGGTAQFNVRTLDTPTGQVLNLGKCALRVATGQPYLMVNFPDTGTKSAFSFYYASASPVIVQVYQKPNGQDSFGGTAYSTKTLPATGTCSLPDADNVYCQWKLCRVEEINMSVGSLKISSADPNMMIDNLTIGYPVPLSGALATVDNLVGEYFNNGTDSQGIAGPLVPHGPPYPHIYGVETPAWHRAGFEDGPELAPDYYYKSGDGQYPGIHGWTTLQNFSDDPKYINVVDGFTEEVSMHVLMGTVVGVYSGLNGTGTLLASVPDVKKSTSDGGFTLFSFDGWARSIAFDTDPAIVDSLRFGHKSSNPIIPVVPSPNQFSSETTEISVGTNALSTDSITPVIFLPDGNIYRNDHSGYPSPNHWMREVSTFMSAGALVQFSFDGLADGVRDFPNQGTLAGTWSSDGATVAASTAASKWGTSSLHVTPNVNEPALELVWPDLFYLQSGGAGTLEAWVRPEGGTSLPYGKTAIMHWTFGGGGMLARRLPWSPDGGMTQTNYVPGVGIVYASEVTPGTIKLEAWLNQRFVGSVNVSAGQFHHVAVTLSGSSGSSQSMGFFVNGTRIATTTLTVNYSNPGYGVITIGQADRTGTFSYYLSDVRVTKGTALYSASTYTVPSAAFTPQAPIAFEGQSRWIRAVPAPSAAGEQDVSGDELIPAVYTGASLYDWHKLDVPRVFAVNHKYNNNLQLRFQIATDAAGSNIVAESHGFGARDRLSTNSYAYAGGASYAYRQTTLMTNGRFEGLIGSGGYPSGRLALRNRLLRVREEGFETFASGAVTPLTLLFAEEATGAQLTVTVTGAATVAGTAAGGQSNLTVGGQRWLSLTGDTTFTFSSPIIAFGFKASDIGDGGGFVKLLLTDTTGTVKEYVPKLPLTQASGQQNYISFCHPGNEYVSVTITSTTSTFGDMGIDDLLISTRSQLNQKVRTITDPFALSAVDSLGKSYASNGGRWRDLYGNNSDTALVFTGAGAIQVDSTKVGSTRYGVYLDKGTESADVTIIADFATVPPAFVQTGTELGVIARKNGNDYYHLNFTYWADQGGDLKAPRQVDQSDKTMVTLTHYPSGEVLLGPYYYRDVYFGTIRWDIEGNTHTIYVESFYGSGIGLPAGINYDGILAQVIDERNLTGKQHGFTIKQPTT